jgi:hypothetical protein
LTRLIERRDDQRRQTEGARQEEEMWRESVACYNERERHQIRAEWYGWHIDQAERHRRTLVALIAHHEGEAQKLLEDNGQEGA